MEAPTSPYKRAAPSGGSARSAWTAELVAEKYECARFLRSTRQEISETYKPSGTRERIAMDPIVESVRSKLLQRSETGIRKYGTNMTRTDLTHRQWLVHAQEEAMDLAIYLERVIRDTPEPS